MQKKVSPPRKKQKQINVNFNSVFAEANRTRKRYRILFGSAGSGKSVNVAQDYVLKLADPRNIGMNLLAIRSVAETNRYSTFSELTAAIYRIWGSEAESAWKITESKLQIMNRLTGNEVIFRGMADDRQRERVKSINFSHGKLTDIWVEEATELRQEDIEILDDRLRGDLINPNLFYQMTFTFNPVSASHWIKKRFFDFQSDEIFTCHSTYKDNAFIDEAYHKRMQERSIIDPEGYRVYGLGEWGELGGLILTNYQVHDFSTSAYCFDDLSIGVDWGYNHYTVMLLVGIHDGEIYICSEIAVREKTEQETVEFVDERQYPKHVPMWVDSASPALIKALHIAGYRARPVEKEPGSVNAQIRWLKNRKIHIHPSCTHTIKEIQQWKWIKDKKTGQYIDEPVPFEDDAMAALRYSIEKWRKARRFNPYKQREKDAV